MDGNEIDKHLEARDHMYEVRYVHSIGIHYSCLIFEVNFEMA